VRFVDLSGGGGVRQKNSRGVRKGWPIFYSGVRGGRQKKRIDLVALSKNMFNYRVWR